MARKRDVLNRLRRGPATNAELQDACCDHSGGISRTIAQMSEVVRIDGASGRGTRAVYALKESANAA